MYIYKLFTDFRNEQTEPTLDNNMNADLRIISKFICSVAGKLSLKIKTTMIGKRHFFV